MKNEILYNRIREGAEKRGLTLTKVAELYDNQYLKDEKTSNGNNKTIINSLNTWGSNSEPTATNLVRLAKILDCDIDYLMGEQTEMRKDAERLSRVARLSYGAVENMIKLCKNNPQFANLINALFDNSHLFVKEEIEEDEEARELAKQPSSLLIDLLYMCTHDFGPRFIYGFIDINEPFCEGRHIWEPISGTEYFQFKRTAMYNSLCRFIDEQRRLQKLDTYRDEDAY